MEPAIDLNNLSWSLGSLPDQLGGMSPTLCAYERARAAFRRLEEIAKRVDESRPKLQEDGSSPERDKNMTAYLSVRREWNQAFCEFDKAVSDYAAALWEERLTAGAAQKRQ